MISLIATAVSNKDFRKGAGKAVRFAGTAVAGFVAFKLLQNSYRNFARQQAQYQLLDSKEARQAQQLKLGMNPSGFDWMFSLDGTNEEALFNAAKSIDSFSKVQSFYSQLYPGRNLVEDLESELEGEALTKFYGYMTKGQIDSIAYAVDIQKPYSFPVGSKVYARGNPYLYAFPEKDQEKAKVLEANAFLGTVIKRLTKSDGSWYLIDGNGFKAYVKEAGLQV